MPIAAAMPGMQKELEDGRYRFEGSRTPARRRACQVKVRLG
jgi:hypothetical protein